MADLFGTGMEADEVAGLPGVAERELKALRVRAAVGRCGEKGNEREGQAPRTDGAGAGTGKSLGARARPSAAGKLDVSVASTSRGDRGVRFARRASSLQTSRLGPKASATAAHSRCSKGPW